MLYRPIVHSSRAAELGRRLGSLALPILVITVIGHRLFGMASSHAFALIVVTVLLGVSALFLSMFGAWVVWEKGYRGGSSAVRGFIYALVALIPAGFGIWGVTSFPRLNDITTDVVDPPLYRVAAFERMGSANPVRNPSAEDLAKQRAAYPDIVTRRFQIGADQLFGAAKKVVTRNGWTVVDEVQPKDETDRGRIEAVAKTLLFGFEDDVIIRIYAEQGGARIDIRSSSRYGEHDLGTNARRIRAFYVSLDQAVTESFGQQ